MGYRGRSGCGQFEGSDRVSIACAGARRRGSLTRRACVLHASGLLLGGSELGLAKVGHRHRGLALDTRSVLNFMEGGCRSRKEMGEGERK